MRRRCTRRPPARWIRRRIGFSSAALAATLVATMLVVPMGAADAGASTRRGDAPDGLVSGAPHVMRLRPRLADLPDARRRVNRRATAAAETAVASCDPARVTALDVVPTTKRAADAAAVCVVLADDRGARALLAASRVSGDGIRVVSRRRVARDRYEVVLRMTVRGATQTLQTPPELADLEQVVDLDGEIAGAARIEASGSGDTAAIIVTPDGGRGFTRDHADELVARFRQALSEQLVTITDEAALARAGRRLVANRSTSLEDKDEFRDLCPNPEAAETLVLGCYDGNRIVVLRVDRADLTGVMPVSLAHEMLHAAFDDLSADDRRKVVRELDTLLDERDDERIDALLEEYRRLEPGARDTELHSLVGTQVAELPRALERHYRRYFADRSAVVDAFTQYQAIFDTLQARYDELAAQAESLEAQITEAEGAQLAAGQEADRLFEEIQSLRNQGRIDESNALVDAQNAVADRANALVDQHNALIDQYNALVDELNALAVALNESYNAISPEPIELESG